jgi:hypothetical protein
MKIYRILWTYIANHSEQAVSVEASSFQDAVDRYCKRTSLVTNEDFMQRATFHVFLPDEYRIYKNGRWEEPTARIIRAH